MRQQAQTTTPNILKEIQAGKVRPRLPAVRRRAVSGRNHSQTDA